MTLPLLVGFGREICGDLEAAERREWWLANGVGGYAAGTIAGTLTRRYHGLLIAPLGDSLDRHLLAAKADAELVLPDASGEEQTWPLHSNRWADGAIAPQGHRHIECFELDGRMPVWRFAIGDLRRRTAHLDGHRRATPPMSPFDCSPASRPGHRGCECDLLVNARDHHHVARRDQLEPTVDTVYDRLHVNLGTPHDLRILADGADLEAAPAWVEHFDLTLEGERGLERCEDHFAPGSPRSNSPRIPGAASALTIEDETETNLNGSRQRFLVREAKLLAAAIPVLRRQKSMPKWVGQLVLAADSFRVPPPVARWPPTASR